MSDSGLLETFMHCRGELLRFLRLRGAAPEEAEDILQDIGLKLSAPMAATGPIDQPRAYLYRMATHQFLLRRRSDSRQRRRDEDWTDVQGGLTRDADPAPSAETALIARQHLDMLQAAIDRMPERTRTIFRLFRLEKWPQKRIAGDLGISVSAVEKHLARAYQDILQARKEYDAETRPPRHLSHEQGYRP